MLVMVVKIVFNIVPLLSFGLLPCMFVILRIVILTERKDLFPRSFRCFAPLQHDKYLLLSSCLFVILSETKDL